MRTAIHTHLALAVLVLVLVPTADAQTNGSLMLTADSLTEDRVSVSHFEYGRGHFGRCTALTGEWRYHAGDNPAWADPQYDDSDWTVARTWFDTFAQDGNEVPPGLPGIGWFRLHLRVDSSLAQMPLGLAIYRGSATEVYLDGQRVHTTGQVGRRPAEEVPEWSYASTPISLRPDTTHVIAVRYSNFSAKPVLQAGENAGYYVVLGNLPTMRESHIRLTRRASIHQLLLTGVAMALAFLHLILFLFYPGARPHLHFALIAMGMVWIVFGELQIHFVTSTEADLLRFRLLQVGALVSALALLGFAHEVVHQRIPRYLYILAALGTALSIGLWFVHLRPYMMALYLLLIIDGARVITYGVVRGRTGIWIIGLGFLPLVVVLILHIAAIMEIMDLWWDIYEVPMYGYTMLLLALSMSVYLARDFARTKRDLERTNNQLENYSRTLEERVDARTQDLRTEMQKTEAQAQRLRELDRAKSRFFANISHEFRTPLTLILGPAESALDGRYGALPEPLKTALRRIQHQARRLLRLVEQLLDLSRVEHNKLTLHPRTQDLVGFLRHHVRAFTPLAERHGVRLAFRTEAERLPVPFDPDQLEKVIANLLSNALKFTPEGGKVFVVVRRQELVDVQWAEVAVRDTGPGIGPEDLERIFERFEQVDGDAARPHEGTGIGLSLAKELTELHGGALLVESEPGFGSSFFVRLPLRAEDGERPRRHLEPVPFTADAGDGTVAPVALIPEVLPLPSNGQGRSDDGEEACPVVLVVEDNAEVRAYLREQLAPRYRVLEAENGADGLAVARVERPDLVLADVMMPGTDGIALLDALKADEQLRAIPVMLLTARAAEDDRVEGIRRGAEDYLVKPFNTQELLARVERLIQTRRSLQARYRKELRVAPADVVVDSDHEIFLRQVLDAADDHLAEPSFGAEALAEAVGMSRRQLTRKLKALLDEPPSDLLRRLRLERAAQLLDAEHGRVSEIAYAVGFKSPSHFTRIFRAHFGCTPSAYRDEHA